MRQEIEDGVLCCFALVFKIQIYVSVFYWFFFFIVLVWEWSIGVLNGFFVYMHENMLTVFVWKTLMYACTCVQYLYALPVAGVVIIKIYINQLLLVNATIFAIKSKRMWNTFFNLTKYWWGIKQIDWSFRQPSIFLIFKEYTEWKISHSSVYKWNIFIYHVNVFLSGGTSCVSLFFSDEQPSNNIKLIIFSFLCWRRKI